MNKNNIIIILIILVILELLPYIITIIFPKFCYSCTSISQILTNINYTYNLSYISWMSYLYLIINLINFINKSIEGNKKYLLIFGCLIMIYLPIYPILNIINIILFLIYKNPPFIKNHNKIFPASINIEKNSQIIIDEYKNYIKNNKAECIRYTNPAFSIENTNISENCWRGIYLKKTGVIYDDISKYFPNTTNLLKDKQIHNAFFSILDPGVEIPSHIGYYKGYLRYHLGVIIPNNDTNRDDDKAYIICGNEKYIWKENNGVLFDDMYSHYVKNPTNKTRVVLYLDIIRESDSYIINKINNYGIYLIENSLLLNIFLKNQHKQIKIENNI